MNHYRHILIACDDSAQSDLVAKKAFAIAQSHQAKLSIVHVLDNIPMPDTPYGTIIPVACDDETDDINTLLIQEKQKLTAFAKTFDIDVSQCWLIWGIPKQEIVNLAQREQVDLIVMGSHSRHGLAVLLGSTTNSVLHHSPCDVLAVRLGA